MAGLRTRLGRLRPVWGTPRSPAAEIPPNHESKSDPVRPDRLSRVPWRRIGKSLPFAILIITAFAAFWATWVVPPWGPSRRRNRAFYTLPLTIAWRGTGEAPVDAAALPPHVRGAFIAIEDRRFTDRLGIDPRRLTRAFWYNFRAGAMVQDGSTITQHCGGNRPRVGHGAEVGKRGSTVLGYKNGKQ
jgi:membrane peptidoglycan carboxypeptidase